MSSIELPQRRSSVVLRDLGKEAMLYDPERDQIVRLNITARRIWEMCTGEYSLQAIADVLQEEFQFSPSIDLHQDVVATVGQFAGAGLLTNGAETTHN
jgi:hypothetical protein